MSSNANITEFAGKHTMHALSRLIELINKDSVRHIFLSLFTQGMLSVISFILSFVIAVNTKKEEYGLYILLFSIIGIFGNYHNAIVNTPLTILVRKQKNENSFIGSFAFGQWLVIAPVVLLFIVTATAWSLFHNEFTLIKIAIVLAIGIVSFAWREFLRTVSYSLLKVDLVVRMDLIFVGVVLILLVIMLFTRQVSSYAAITMLGTGYLVSAYVGHCNRNESYKPDWDSIKDVAVQSWTYARWSLVGVTSGLLQHRGYLYVITFALGLGTLGDTSAAHLLMMPVGFLVQSSGKISLAKAAEILAKSGIKKLKLFSISLASALFFCCLIYTLLLFFFFKPIAGILGSKYQNVGGYVWIWAIYFAANCIRYPLSNSLLACSQFRSIAIFDVISGIITITACIVLTKYFYGYGAIWAVAGGEIILCLLTTKLLLTYKIENKIS